MAELRRMIFEAQADLRHAKAAASLPEHPRRFLEVDAFAAKVRLIALLDALRAVSADG